MYDSVLLWTVAHQAPLSMGFFRPKYWSGLPCSPPGDLPNPGIEPTPLISPALAGRFFTSRTTREARLSPYASSIEPVLSLSNKLYQCFWLMGWLMTALLLFLYYQGKETKGLDEGEPKMGAKPNSHITSLWLREQSVCELPVGRVNCTRLGAAQQPRGPWLMHSLRACMHTE